MVDERCLRLRGVKLERRSEEIEKVGLVGGTLTLARIRAGSVSLVYPL